MGCVWKARLIKMKFTYSKISESFAQRKPTLEAVLVGLSTDRTAFRTPRALTSQEPPRSTRGDRTLVKLSLIPATVSVSPETGFVLGEIA